jgi:glyoxylase-like metal-dependent hydrolase (beta-lactamase superfamily II)
MTVVAKTDDIRIDRLETAPYGTNVYTLTCLRTANSVVVDAPGEVQRIHESLRGRQPQQILITHNHFDHISGLAQLKAALQVPVAAHHADATALPVAADLLLNDGEEISVGDLKLRVIFTPGHTAGSICFFCDTHLIAGDTLFPGGPGKTRSPADFRLIIKSITEKIFVLPEETQVHPGHGEATTVGEAKRLYGVFSARPHDPDLCGDVEWIPDQGE